ncbi:hypothetical protein V8E54_003800 [Elaphomyces granulatus]
MSNVMATMEKVKEWDDDQLLDWIQEKRPKLLRVGENLEKFKAAQISGEVFLMLAGDMEFFEKKNAICQLGPAEDSQNWRGRSPETDVSYLYISL